MGKDYFMLEEGMGNERINEAYKRFIRESEKEGILVRSLTYVGLSDLEKIDNDTKNWIAPADNLFRRYIYDSSNEELKSEILNRFYLENSAYASANAFYEDSRNPTLEEEKMRYFGKTGIKQEIDIKKGIEKVFGEKTPTKINEEVEPEHTWQTRKDCGI